MAGSLDGSTRRSQLREEVRRHFEEKRILSTKINEVDLDPLRDNPFVKKVQAVLDREDRSDKLSLLDHILRRLGDPWYRIETTDPHRSGWSMVECVDGAERAGWMRGMNIAGGYESVITPIDGPSSNPDENQPQTFIGRLQARRIGR